MSNFGRLRLLSICAAMVVSVSSGVAAADVAFTATAVSLAAPLPDGIDRLPVAPAFVARPRLKVDPCDNSARLAADRLEVLTRRGGEDTNVIVAAATVAAGAYHACATAFDPRSIAGTYAALRAAQAAVVLAAAQRTIGDQTAAGLALEDARDERRRAGSTDALAGSLADLTDVTIGHVAMPSRPAPPNATEPVPSGIVNPRL